MKKLIKLLQLGLIILVGAGLGFLAFKYNNDKIVKSDHNTNLNDKLPTPLANLSPSPTTTPTATPSPEPTPTPEPTPEPTPAPPSTLSLSVPFTSQAPFAVWDALHEDACEEASLLMVKHYLDHTTFKSKAQADQEIKDLVAYESNSGYGPSITLSQLNTIAQNQFQMKGEVKENLGKEEIKQELAAGHLLIIGAAGKLLPNPYFSNGGPVYHMLVITGYNETGFITNDPGVWQGEHFHYKYADLDQAIHDWNSTDIKKGKKNFLVF